MSVWSSWIVYPGLTTSLMTLTFGDKYLWNWPDSVMVPMTAHKKVPMGYRLGMFPMMSLILDDVIMVTSWSLNGSSPSVIGGIIRYFNSPIWCLKMHCWVNKASSANRLHLFTNNKQYFSLNLLQFLCHTYKMHLKPAKSRKNLTSAG